jgi:DNA-binding GntR family transcriptional regulator
MTTALKTRKKRNTDPAQSDGEVAWRKRYIELYDQQCNAYDAHRLCLEAIDANEPERAAELLEGLVAAHEEEVRQLVK